MRNRSNFLCELNTKPLNQSANLTKHSFTRNQNNNKMCIPFFKIGILHVISIKNYLMHSIVRFFFKKNELNRKLNFNKLVILDSL